MALKDDLKLKSSYAEWEWIQGTCGHCGNPTNFAVVGACPGKGPLTNFGQFAYVCSGCQGINIYLTPKAPGLTERLIPPATPGRAIEGLTADVAAAWLEARSALGVGAPTACEHMCRKILLHIAVVHDGNPKFTFAQAIDHLLAAGVITAQWEPWVKQIKDNGNEAAHELQPVSMDRARHTLEFTQQLLQLVFETKHRMRQFEPKA